MYSESQGTNITKWESLGEINLGTKTDEQEKNTIWLEANSQK